MPLSAGTRLGPYEILAPLGAGGMGEVYRARDSKLKRDVALKVLPAAFADDPERLARFEREAQVLASLNHPNIAQIYGLEDRALIMELVEGPTLADRMTAGPLPLGEALAIARQITDALEAAHERNIVHRDLKPANVKVTPEGQVKVLDFGLAKAAEEEFSGGSENSPTLTMRQTQIGMILGTAAYMAPEQAKGKVVDKRADIWSFGVVLYELLTGQRLFTGEDVSDTLADVLKKQPNWNKAPVQARRLLRECLEKDPKDRLRDIGDAKRLVMEEEAPPVAVSTPRRGLFGWGLAGLAFVALAALAFVHFRERPTERQVLQYTLPAPGKARNVQGFSLSPDGRYVVMPAAGDTAAQLWVRSLDSLEAQPLAGTQNGFYPFWSPDSRYIGFFADGKLKKISVNGGPAQTLCEAVNPNGGAWSREGVILFAPANFGGLSRVPETGGAPVPVTKGYGHRFPMFLPDGRRYLYSSSDDRGTGIYLSSLDGSVPPKRLVPDVSNPRYVPPLTASGSRREGHLLFVRGQTLMAQPVDPETMSATSDLFPVAEQISRSSGQGDNAYSSSETGMLIYQAGTGTGGRQQVWFDRAGKEVGRVGGIVQGIQTFALSPDGKRVVTSRSSDDQQHADLWITDTEHHTDSRFTFVASRNMFPVWSPDGSKVAFVSNRAGAINIYQKAADGTGKDELLFESKENKFVYDWTHDGRFLIFSTQDPKTRDDIWALPLIGDRKPILLVQSEFAETAGQVSPDRRWLAYSSDESGRPEVYVQPFAPGAPAGAKPATGKWQVSTAGGRQARWRGDSKELCYVAPDRKLMAVEVSTGPQGFEHRAPQALFESRSDSISSAGPGYVPSPDGKRFLIGVGPDDQTAPQALTVVVNWLGGVKK